MGVRSMASTRDAAESARLILDEDGHPVARIVRALQSTGTGRWTMQIETITPERIEPRLRLVKPESEEGA